MNYKDGAVNMGSNDDMSLERGNFSSAGKFLCHFFNEN